MSFIPPLTSDSYNNSIQDCILLYVHSTLLFKFLRTEFTPRVVDTDNNYKSSSFPIKLGVHLYYAKPITCIQASITLSFTHCKSMQSWHCHSQKANLRRITQKKKKKVWATLISPSMGNSGIHYIQAVINSEMLR